MDRLFCGVVVLAAICAPELPVCQTWLLLYWMYQNVLCGLPESLQNLFFADRSRFDKIMEYATNVSLSLQSGLAWAKIGLGPNVTTFGQLLEGFEPFFLDESHLAQLRLIPLFVNDPALDTATNMQSELLWASIGTPFPGSVLVQPEVESGVGLHCGVGSNKQNARNILNWLSEVLK